VTRRGLTRGDYAAIAEFRYQLRRFLAFSESAAAEAGLPAQQHQALLAIAGRGDAHPPSVGFLAERLLIAPHTAAELVARMVEADLLTKTVSASDRRRVQLGLTPRARDLLSALTPAHLEELRALEPALVQALGRRGLGLRPPQGEVDPTAAGDQPGGTGQDAVDAVEGAPRGPAQHADVAGDQA
jgi:DNA-binding MarR family transcriptional regulator